MRFFLLLPEEQAVENLLRDRSGWSSLGRMEGNPGEFFLLLRVSEPALFEELRQYPGSHELPRNPWIDAAKMSAKGQQVFARHLGQTFGEKLAGKCGPDFDPWNFA